MLSKERPLRVLTGIGGLRDIIVGVGFMSSTVEIASLQLYQNFNHFLFGMSAPIAGWAFLIIGVITLASAIMDWPAIATRALWFQSFLWTFSGWMYLLAGSIFHAVVFGFLFSLPAAYTAMQYKYRVLWMQEEIELRREIDELKALIRGP